MNIKEMQDKINQHLIEQLSVNIEQIIPTANFRDDLGADSLDSVEIALLLEDEFGISISDEELVKMPTVQSAYNMVMAKKGIKD